jgi:hypothetical protein
MSVKIRGKFIVYKQCPIWMPEVNFVPADAGIPDGWIEVVREEEPERSPRCDHLYAELPHGALPVRCGLNRGHEGSHRFTWPA